MRARNTKNGAGDNQFGVLLGDIQTLAKEAKTIFLLNPKKLTSDAIDQMVRSARFVQVADGLNSYVVKNQADEEGLHVALCSDLD